MDEFLIPCFSPTSEGIETLEYNLNTTNGSPYDDDSQSICPGSFNLCESPSIGDSLCGLNLTSMDLDPIASLFAFNTTCTSPTYNKSEYSMAKNQGYSCKPAPTDPLDPYFSPIKQGYHSSNSANYQSNQNHCGFQGSQSPNYSPNSSVSSPNYSNVAQNYSSNPSTPINGISYSFHPQIQMNPSSCTSSHQHPNFYNSQPSNEHYPNAQQTLFPGASMSVNLSMNMTMGFTASEPQWSAPGVNYQNNYPNQGSTPTYHNHTPSYATPSPSSYTFTAEFRPSSEPIVLPPIEKEFPSVCAIKSQSPCYGNRSPIDNHSRYNCQKSKLSTRMNPFEDSEINDVKSPSTSSANLCRICGKTYARPSTLKTHLRTHSGERPYRCNTCTKSFSQAANLTAHIRTHSGEKPFRCPVCERRFSQSSSVTTHMRTHSGERPYRCCMCKKAFSDSSTLTKHLRIHSGEKPYQCKLCLLRFSQSGNLNRHMRIHSNLM